MKACCPHCGYEYDNIELSDIGCKATCTSCEKEFVVHEFPASQEAPVAPEAEAPLLSIEEIEHLRLEREVNKNDDKPVAAPKKAAKSPAAPTSNAPAEAGDVAEAARELSSRYLAAYMAIAGLVKVGRVTRTLGQIVICVGLGLGILAASKAFGADSSGWSNLFVGGTLIMIAGIILYVWGILIATVSQVFQSIIDIAINSSPILTNEDKLSLLS